MLLKISRIFVVVVVMVMLLGSIASSPVQAQGDAAYVKTFDLPTTPTTEGAYAGVNPKGAHIVWWHNHTKIREDAVKAAVDAFNKGNPWGITVEPISKGDYGPIYNAMLAALQTKELPNLVVAYQNQAATYQTVKSLVDINDFMNDKVYGLGKAATDDFYPAFLQSDFNPLFNQRLGFPVYRSMEVLYYNVDALKAMGYDGPPKNWDQFAEMACKFTSGDKIGYYIRTDASQIAAAAFAQGGDIYDYKTGKFIYDSPEAQVAPAAMQELKDKGCAKLIPAAFADQNDFAAGKALFYMGSTSGLQFVSDAMKQANQTFKFDIAPIPYKDKPVQNIYGASISIVTTTKEQQLASWLFLRWYSEAEQEAVWAKTTGYFPVRQSAAAGMADYMNSFQPYKSAFELLSKADLKAEPALAGYDPVRRKAQDAFNNVLDGKNVADEFTKLNDVANSIQANFKVDSPLPTAVPTATPGPSPTPKS